jgi:hypothetical protein
MQEEQAHASQQNSYYGCGFGVRHSVRVRRGVAQTGQSVAAKTAPAVTEGGAAQKGPDLTEGSAGKASLGMSSLV